MRKELRFLIESFFVSAFFVFAIFVYFIAMGMYMTQKHVPDIVSGYESSEQLSSSVSFGWIMSFQWFEYMLVFVSIGLVYYFARLAVYKFRRKR